MHFAREVVENQLICIEHLLLSKYFGRTVDNGRGHFTEVRVARLETMYSDADKTQDVWFG